ncbi:MAG: recombinase family protein [Nitriliruptorales bacterium]
MERQREDCKAIADRLGWEVVAYYIDNDVSAADRSKTRPAWTDLLADAGEHRFNAIIAWHDDRLWRDVVEQQTVFGILRNYGVYHVHASRLYDTRSDDDSILGGVQALFAQKETADKRRRIRRKVEELARDGKVGGGGTRPYGYADDRITIVPHEQEIVYECANRVLRGEGVRGIVLDLNRREVPTVTGARWTAQVLRRVLVAPRTAGLRELRGEVVADAVWEPLIDREKWEKVKVVLDGRNLRRRAPRTYLLTGLIVCGREGCGARMVARPKADGRRQYVCARDYGGCGKIACLAEPLEQEVRDQVIARLDTPALGEAIQRAASADARIQALINDLRDAEERLATLTRDFYTAGDLTLGRGEYLQARAALEAKVERARRTLEQHRGVSVLTGLPDSAAAVREAWDSGDLYWQRQLLDALVNKVELTPAVRGRNRFDPDRVAIIWRA